jgi:hypothetical protein
MPLDETIKHLLRELRSHADIHKSALSIERAIRESNLTLREISLLEGVFSSACIAVLRSEKGDMPRGSCDFCHKKREEVHLLIEGPMAAICDECIPKAQRAIDEARAIKEPKNLS